MKYLIIFILLSSCAHTTYYNNSDFARTRVTDLVVEVAHFEYNLDRCLTESEFPDFIKVGKENTKWYRRSSRVDKRQDHLFAEYVPNSKFTSDKLIHYKDISQYKVKNKCKLIIRIGVTSSPTGYSDFFSTLAKTDGTKSPCENYNSNWCERGRERNIKFLDQFVSQFEINANVKFFNKKEMQKVDLVNVVDTASFHFPYSENVDDEQKRAFDFIVAPIVGLHKSGGCKLAKDFSQSNLKGQKKENMEVLNRLDESLSAQKIYEYVKSNLESPADKKLILNAYNSLKSSNFVVANWRLRYPVLNHRNNFEEYKTSIKNFHNYLEAYDVVESMKEIISEEKKRLDEKYIRVPPGKLDYQYFKYYIDKIVLPYYRGIDINTLNTYLKVISNEEYKLAYKRVNAIIVNYVKLQIKDFVDLMEKKGIVEL